MKYQEIKNENNEVVSIQRTDEDGRIYSIPTDPANSDYQAYLANPDGNTPTGLNPTA